MTTLPSQVPLTHTHVPLSHLNWAVPVRAALDAEKTRVAPWLAPGALASQK
ncbi:hypothetical protein [Pyxidicoccus trucidator]|uniref:hypothetical protein n=1 Tax=Pyxidicoccus trucidator TaxID=2709662 RepID=UPI001966FCFD|nr:hypothetical protein [Pyxidicoccus trucidator]